MQIRLNDIFPKSLLLLAGLLRLAFILLSGKLNETEYWEYGEFAQQLLAGHGYSFPFTDANLNFLPDQYYPSALMPPGYVFFLLPFMLISDAIIRNLLFFLVQIAFSLLAMQLIFRWSEKRFEKPVAILILLLQACYPELIYAVGTVGPTIIFHLLFAGILVSLSEIKYPVITGVLAGVLVLMRSEALLPVGLLLAGTWLAGQKKAAFTASMAMFISLGPWLLRNQLQFGKPMLSASAGVNFYRGNNPGEIGDWPVQPDALERKLRLMPEKYEQQSDSLAMASALIWISENPSEYLRRLPEKFLRFWWLDWPDPRTHHWLYVVPWIICLPLGLAGLWVRGFEGRAQLMMLFLTYTFIVLVFFPQARYLTMVKFFWLIPAGLGLKDLWMMIFPQSKFLSAST